MQIVIEEQVIDLSGIKVHVAKKAAPHSAGLPLLFFNGIGANHELLIPLWEKLDAFECITFNMPGIGASSEPKYPMRFKQLAKMTSRVLEHLGYVSVDVLGVSWGGALAQQFAYDFPKRCRHLILVATSAGVAMVPGRPSVFLKLTTPRRYRDKDYMKDIAPDIYGGELRTNKALLDRHLSNLKAPISKRSYLYQLAAILGWTSIHWLHRITQPTLIIAGEDDPLIPIANAKMLKKRIPDSRMIIVQCGHLLMLTKADEVAGAITRFLLERQDIVSEAMI